MTKYRNIPLLLSTILVLSLTAFAQTNRRARLEDDSGVKTDVANLRFLADDQRDFSPAAKLYGYLILSVEPLKFAIPLTDIKSITSTIDKGQKNFKVLYISWGQENKISGHIYGEFVCNSNVGQLKIPGNKLKELLFIDPPVATGQKEMHDQSLKKNRATLVLQNGTEISVGYLERYYTYYSRERYIIGGEYVDAHKDDFPFQRGGSLLTLNFGELNSIEVGSGGAVSVKLRNGNSISGTLVLSGENGVIGFTGISDNGDVFIDVKSVKRIEFDNVGAK
jgi:hypothetical protein